MDFVGVGTLKEIALNVEIALCGQINGKLHITAFSECHVSQQFQLETHQTH